MKWSAFLLTLPFLALQLPTPCSARPNPDDPASAPNNPIESKALSVLRDRCLTCHNDRKAEGGYNLSSLGRLMKAGDSGLAPWVAGDANASEIQRRIVSEDESLRMPSESPKLSEQEMEAVRHWIEMTPAYSTDNATSIVDAIAETNTILDITQPPVYATYPKVPTPLFSLDPVKNRMYVAGVNEVLVYDAADNRIIERWTGFGRQISPIQIDSSGNWAAIASGQPSKSAAIHLVDVQNSSRARTIMSLSDLPLAMAFSPTAPILAIGSMDGGIRIFDVELNKPLLDVAAHADQVLAIAWKADGTQFISGSRDRTARVYDFPSLDLKGSFVGHERTVGAVGIVDLGALTLDETGTLRLWSINDPDRVLTKRTGLPQRLLKFHSTPKSVSWLDEQKIETVTIQRREEENGTDKEGKPKKKNIHEFVSPVSLPFTSPLNLRAITSWGFNPATSEFSVATRDGWLHPIQAPSAAPENESAAATPVRKAWRMYPN